MTVVDDLVALQTTNGGPDAMTAAEQLAALLDLPGVGLQIRGARIVGRGARASADLYLSDGTEITFETLRDFANPSRLALEIVACTGATPSLKLPQAIRAVALLRAIAEHEATLTVDHLSIEWGTSFDQVPEGGDPNQALIDSNNALAEQIARSAEEQRVATEAHTAAVTESNALQKRTLDFAAAVQSTSNYQLTKTLADLISGHIVGRGVVGRAFTPGTGVEHAYAPSIY